MLSKGVFIHHVKEDWFYKQIMGRYDIFAMYMSNITAVKLSKPNNGCQMSFLAQYYI